MKTERAGFVTLAFRNLQSQQQLTPNLKFGKDLGRSGPFPLLLVVPGHGGAVPGQNRDKFFPLPWRPMQPPDGLPDMSRVWFRIQLAQVRRGRRPRKEVEAERFKLREQYDREIDDIVAEMHAILPQHLAK